MGIENFLDDDNDQVPAAPEESKEPAPAEPPAAPAEPATPEPNYKEQYENLQAALRQERYQRQQYEQETARLRGTVNNIDALKQELAEFRASQRPATNEEDEFERDPIGALKAKVSKIEQESVAERKQREENETRSRQFSEFQTHVVTQATQYARENPDYEDAYAYVLDRRVKDFQAMGIPQHLWQQYIQNEEVQIAQLAMQQGRNPAEMVHSMAKTWGWKKAEAAAPADKGTANNEKLDKLEQGMKASKSLSGGGGASDRGPSLKDINEMSDKEFDAFWNDFAKSQKRA